MPTKNKLTKIHAHGKLLLTGEYFVLDGAKALALPTNLGQSIHLFPHPEFLFYWRSFDHNKNLWFEAVLSLTDLKVLKTTDEKTSKQLEKILQAIRLQKPEFLQDGPGLLLESFLEFPRLWGLGSSSTLISCLAKWANIEPFKLLADTFGGSGYDLACADATGPIIYQRIKKHPSWEESPFNPGFAPSLYFVYLERKQNSRSGIAHYRSHKKSIENEARHITELTTAIEQADNLVSFERLINKHEHIVSRTLNLPMAKDLHFSDFWGSIKSLGAWGGDFILATSSETEYETKKYFNEKGFKTVINYSELVLSRKLVITNN